MSDLIQMIVTVICAVLASSGFWAFVQKKSDRSSAEIELLIGLGHDRIVYLGMSYLERGWLTEDEYENLHDYLYIPYEKNGGNGSAKKVMESVEKLPIYKTYLHAKEATENETKRQGV